MPSLRPWHRAVGAGLCWAPGRARNTLFC